MVGDHTQYPNHYRDYIQVITREPSQVNKKVPILGQLLGSSFNLGKVQGDCYLNEIDPSVPLVLEKEVWMTGQNILVHGNGDVQEDLCVLVFTNQ